MSPGFCESFRLTLLRDAVPLIGPFAPLTVDAAGGCLNPDGGRFDPREGEGDECKDLAPLMVVCTAGRGGRFSFCCDRADLAGMTAAIGNEDQMTDEDEPR